MTGSVSSLLRGGGNPYSKIARQHWAEALAPSVYATPKPPAEPCRVSTFSLAAVTNSACRIEQATACDLLVPRPFTHRATDPDCASAQ